MEQAESSTKQRFTLSDTLGPLHVNHLYLEISISATRSNSAPH